MKMKSILTAGLLALSTLTVHADTFNGGAFSMNFVPIGNAGNAPDPIYSLDGTIGWGTVSYDYNMAVTDVSQTMLASAQAALGGTSVVNLGGGAWAGSQPAANVTWYQAAAFVNYLNTSSGYAAAYNLTFSGSTPTGLTLWTGGNIWTLGGSNPFRNANTHYFLPSENEWYKAAYHKNDGVTADYWLFATGSDTAPTAVASGTAAGTAVYTAGSTNPTAPAAVDQSGGLSPYGTQGQTGNVWQWEESEFFHQPNSIDGTRGVRGGYWGNAPVALQASFRSFGSPTDSANNIGFRVASVPEPSCAGLMLSAGLLALARRRRRSA